MSVTTQFCGPSTRSSILGALACEVLTPSVRFSESIETFVARDLLWSCHFRSGRTLALAGLFGWLALFGLARLAVPHRSADSSLLFELRPIAFVGSPFLGDNGREEQTGYRKLHSLNENRSFQTPRALLYL